MKQGGLRGPFSERATSIAIRQPSCLSPNVVNLVHTTGAVRACPSRSLEVLKNASARHQHPLGDNSLACTRRLYPRCADAQLQSAHPCAFCQDAGEVYFRFRWAAVCGGRQMPNAWPNGFDSIAHWMRIPSLLFALLCVKSMWNLHAPLHARAPALSSIDRRASSYIDIIAHRHPNPDWAIPLSSSSRRVCVWARTSNHDTTLTKPRARFWPLCAQFW